MKLYFKYMVSQRCKTVVQDTLQKPGIINAILDPGVVDIQESISKNQHNLLKEALSKTGLELLDDNKSILVEKVKNIITEMIHCDDEIPKLKYSDFIGKKSGNDYSHFSNIFSRGDRQNHATIHHPS